MSRASLNVADLPVYYYHQDSAWISSDLFTDYFNEEILPTIKKHLPHQRVINGTVKEKTYGKQKVYVTEQNSFPPLDEAALKDMDHQINQNTETLKELERASSETEAKLRSLNSSLTTEEAEHRVQELEEEVQRLQEKLSHLQENQVPISKEDKEQITKENQDMIKLPKGCRRI
ncbi:unnamed protein product, partial [Meganyctiphanes norvegica]